MPVTSGLKLIAGIGYDFHETTLDPDPLTTYGDLKEDGTGVRSPKYATQSILAAVDDYNKYNVDLTVWDGDLVNGGLVGNGNQRHLNSAAFVSDLSGLNAKSHVRAGHWDLWDPVGLGYGPADFTQFYDNTTGVGTLVPTGDETPQTPWWPTPASDDSPYAYSIVKNGFKLIFLCTIMGQIGLDTVGKSDDLGDASAISQLDWLELRLIEAAAASQPIIVFTHQPLKSTDSSLIGAPVLALPTGYAECIALLESYAPVIVFSGHIHRDNSTVISNGVYYFNMHGNVWGSNAEDDTRKSHAIAKIISGDPPLIYTTGYGYAKSENINTLFTDDFNDTDWSDKWTVGGDAEAFVEENGTLKCLWVPDSTDILTAQNINVESGKVYRVDFEITYKNGVGGTYLLIGGSISESGEIDMVNYAVGKHSVNVTAPDNGTIHIRLTGSGLTVWLNSLTIKEEIFLAA